MPLVIMNRRSRHVKRFVEIQQRRMEASEQAGGFTGLARILDPVQGPPFDEAQHAPEPVAVFDPEITGARPHKARREHALVREMGGNGIDILVNVCVEDRMQALQNGALTAAPGDLNGKVDETPRDPLQLERIDCIVLQHRRRRRLPFIIMFSGIHHAGSLAACRT